jgi:hypothetical protein
MDTCGFDTLKKTIGSWHGWVDQNDALLGPGVNPLEGSPNVKLRKLGTEGHAPDFQL